MSVGVTTAPADGHVCMLPDGLHLFFAGREPPWRLLVDLWAEEVDR